MKAGLAVSRLARFTSSTSNELFRVASHSETMEGQIVVFFALYSCNLDFVFFIAKPTDVTLLVSMYLYTLGLPRVQGAQKDCADSSIFSTTCRWKAEQVNNLTKEKKKNMQRACEVVQNEASRDPCFEMCSERQCTDKSRKDRSTETKS